MKTAKAAVSRVECQRLEKRLRARLDTLNREIAGELRESGTQDYAALAGDEGDRASVDLIADTRLFDLQRDVVELDAVRAALDRIKSGAYGLCILCGEPIDPDRLRADPSVPRCIDCQLRSESGRARPREHEY